MHVERTQKRLELIRRGNLNSESPEEHEFPTYMRNVTLKKHQRVLLKAMRNAEARSTPLNGDVLVSRKGIVGDKVGSGKSFAILALLGLDPVLKSQDSLAPTPDPNIYVVKKTSEECFVPCNIIVAPHGLVRQWQTYIQLCAQTKDFTVITKRKDVPQASCECFRTGTVLCSSTFFNDLARVLDGKTVSRVIFDEADSIPIKRCARIRANFVWFISSSMHNLLFPSGSYVLPGVRLSRERTDGICRSGFIRDTFTALYDMHQDIVDAIFLKCADDFVDESFNLPNPVVQTVLCRAPGFLKIINNATSAEVLRMIHAGDIRGATERLGFASDTAENVVRLVTSGIQKKLDNARARRVYVSNTHHGSDAEKDAKIKRVDDEIQKLESQAAEIESRLAADADICPVCFEAFQNPAATVCCRRLFCLECITRSMASRPACPTCRSVLKRDMILVITERPAEHPPVPDKCTALKRLIAQAPVTSSFLIFAEFDNSLAEISDMLDAAEIQHAKISGNSNQISKAVERFREGIARVLLLNGRYHGTGLNLQTATDLVIYHRMSEDLESQIIGRAQRPGRTTPLRLHYLVHEDEHATS